MNTPIDMNEEHLEEYENDSKQYLVLGRLCLIYGGFVMMLNFIPNSWESRLYISLVGALILIVGLVLWVMGKRIRSKIPVGNKKVITTEFKSKLKTEIETI